MKEKSLPSHAKQARRAGRSLALRILGPEARRGRVVSATPRPLYPYEKIRYPLYKTLGGLQDRSRLVRKILSS
jgi:hypothetical protein